METLIRNKCLIQLYWLIQYNDFYKQCFQKETQVVWAGKGWQK